MREFYTQLATGADVATSLRDAKLPSAGHVRSPGGAAPVERRAGLRRWARHGRPCEDGDGREGVKAMAVLTEHERRAVLERGPARHRHQVHGACRRHAGVAGDARGGGRGQWRVRGVRGRDQRDAEGTRCEPHRTLPRVCPAGRRTHRPGGHVHEGGDRRRRAMDVPGRPSRWRGGDGWRAAGRRPALGRGEGTGASARHAVRVRRTLRGRAASTGRQHVDAHARHPEAHRQAAAAHRPGPGRDRAAARRWHRVHAGDACSQGCSGWTSRAT